MRAVSKTHLPLWRDLLALPLLW